jgi:deoxyribodipyrimidine photo-lyase
MALDTLSWGRVKRRGGGLVVLHGDPVEEIPRLARELAIDAVYANHDDDPYARTRDALVAERLAMDRVELRTCKDHVVLERGEVLTNAGRPFGVFTPYKNAWLRRLSTADLAAHDTRRHAARLSPPPIARPVPGLAELGFEPSGVGAPVGGSAEAGRIFAEFLLRIDRYAELRDFPAARAPSYLSAHLRFGRISVRLLERAAHARLTAGSAGAAAWLGELIWRDFFHQLLYHHPRVVEGAFRAEYESIEWERGERAERLFAAWCEGRTGYPLVDAAMRELNSTGYMHNRLRMVAASFLCKDLGIDWRRGESYFALKLDDFDLAANNGGWQWAASTGCDAQPYFRIFNPVNQSRNFDPHGEYIRAHVPELATLPAAALHAPWEMPGELAAAGVELGRHYPHRIIDRRDARRRTLERYGAARRPSSSVPRR